MGQKWWKRKCCPKEVHGGAEERWSCLKVTTSEFSDVHLFILFVVCLFVFLPFENPSEFAGMNFVVKLHISQDYIFFAFF